jgi:hypothetical protein
MFTRKPPVIAAAAAQQRLYRIVAGSSSSGRLPPLGFDPRVSGQALICRSSYRGWDR